MDTISTRYAKALIEIAIEESKVYEYQSQMKFVHSVIKENSELVTFLKHNSIKDIDKKSLIEKIFKDNVNINVLHFIYLLIDKKRINYLSQICRDFNSECNNYRGILEGVIYSTEVLTNEKIELSLLDNRQLKIRYGENESFIQCFDTNEFPDFKKIDTNDYFALTQKDLLYGEAKIAQL